VLIERHLEGKGEKDRGICPSGLKRGRLLNLGDGPPMMVSWPTRENGRKRTIAGGHPSSYWGGKEGMRLAVGA